jgi:hypothetical protein
LAELATNISESIYKLTSNYKYIEKSGISYINKRSLTKEMKRFEGRGTADNPRKKKIIVSLTTFPERGGDVHYCLYSLLKQSLKPDLVILWLGNERYPNKEKSVPKSTLEMEKHGLTIDWHPDIKAYTKLIPALTRYPNDIIVTADDDVYYPENWLEILYNSYIEHPEHIHCHRAHRITFKGSGETEKYDKWEKRVSDNTPSVLNFATGVGGVLFPPNVFYNEITNRDLFVKLCENGDDIWYWAMAALKGTRTMVAPGNISNLTYINPERELGLNKETTLMKVNVDKDMNDEQLHNVIGFFPDIQKTLYSARRERGA